MSIEKQVIDVIADQLNIEDKSTITPSSNFIEDLGADSLDTVELVMALEEKFDVTIPDLEAEKITTVEAAIEYVEKIKNNG